MDPRSTNPDVRHDLLFLFDVTDGNPNGDPDAGNRPRQDSEDQRGLVTDVSLKRKVRDTIGLAAQSLLLDADRYQIFVEAGHALNTRAEQSYSATGLAPDKKYSSEQTAAARQWLCDRYVDIRLFGAVLSTGKTKSLGQIRGPLQFGMARSINQILPVEHAITRVTQSRQEDIDKGETTEMGNKWTVPYALYQVQIHYAATRGRQTGVTEQDLAAFYTTLLNMFDHDRSATRGIMAARGLYVFNHADAFGNAPAQALLDRVRAQQVSEGTLPPRSFTDYKVEVDDANLPDKIHLEVMLG